MLDATTSMVQYKGNGAQSVFPIPFPFQEAAHIHAHVSEGMDTRSLNPGVDFTIAAGELVLLGDALAAGQLLTVRRLLPLTQEILFHNQGPNSPQAIEEAVDKLTMISQQLQDAVAVCVQAPDAETAAELADSAAANASRVAAVEQGLSAKADRAHAHAQNEIPGLAAALAGKADAAATTQALAGKASLAQLAAKADSAAVAAKADRGELSAKADASQLALKADKTELAAKADAAHSHAVGAVDGLSAALAAKLDADDPRLGLIGSGGGTADHAELENRDAADQHPQSAVTNLTADLSALRAGLAEREEADGELFDHIETLAGRTDELSARAGAAASRMDGVDADIKAEDAKITALAGRVSAAESAASGMRADIAAAQTDAAEAQSGVTAAESSLDSLAAELERLAERLGALEETPGGTPGQGGGSEGGLVGDIRLLPFRADALPQGWHFCDGAALPLSGAAGQALASLPESFKTDWGVTVDGDAITLPDLFDAETGEGLFLRGVRGPDRLPGSAQGDAIRNITGSYSASDLTGVTMVVNSVAPFRSKFTGAFTTQETAPRQFTFSERNIAANTTGDLLFDASLAVPTAEENRPVNIGMTPAIYLGA